MASATPLNRRPHVAVGPTDATQMAQPLVSAITTVTVHSDPGGGTLVASGGAKLAGVTVINAPGQLA